MFRAASIQNTKLLERHDEYVLCQIQNRPVKIPIDELWDEGDSLPAIGETFTLRVSTLFARQVLGIR